MTGEPDLCFDIDALFEHMGDGAGLEQEWHFLLRAAELKPLEEVANVLQDDFIVQLQDQVEEIDEEGNRSIGEPVLGVICRGTLSVDAVKKIAERMNALANDRGLVYEGVNNYDAIDEHDLWGWVAPDEAVEYLPNCGLEIDADLPWAFLVLVAELDSTKLIAKELKSNEFTDYDVFDYQSNIGVCIYVAGRNNESELVKTSTKISQIVERNSGRLKGIHFHSREELVELMGANEMRSSIYGLTVPDEFVV